MAERHSTDANSAYSLRKQPRQRRSVATVTAILDAAARILTETGYATASTNRIAERAGVSIGSLYEYFPGKEAVFGELRRREAQKAYAELVTRSRPEHPRDAIRHLVSARLRWMRRNPGPLCRLGNRSATACDRGNRERDLRGLLGRLSRRAGCHRGLLRPKVELRFLAEFLMRAVSATANDYGLRAPERLDDPQLEQALIDMIERYLLNDDG